MFYDIKLFLFFHIFSFNSIFRNFVKVNRRYSSTKYNKMNTENYVTVRTYHDHIIGEIMISALNNAGIQTFRFDEINNMIPTENLIEIKVHQSDVDAALEVIEAQESL